MVNVAVLVSGGGTNLQAILDAKAAGLMPSCEIKLVLASKAGVYALERAKAHGIHTEVVDKHNVASEDEYDVTLLNVLKSNDIHLVVLAGFLTILSPRIISAYQRRIINVHPSLIPSFCGDGFYGLKVHRAALERGVKLTGATVHYVNEITDGGEIILQKAVEVQDGDTPEILQKRVMETAEWQLLPRAVELAAQGLV